MVLFKDIHKKTEDLASKDWAHDNKWEVENNWKTGAFAFKNKIGLAGQWSIPTFALTGSQIESGNKAAISKAPITSNEVVYETKQVQVNVKIDSEGKGSDDIKFKDLGVAGLSATLKTSFTARSAIAVEAQAEYAADGHHWLLSVNPSMQSFSVSNVFEAHKQATLGAEVSGPLASISGFTGYRYSLTGLFSNPGKDGVFGAKLSQELGSSQIGLLGYIHLTQGNISTAVNVSHTVGDDKGLPKLTFVGKHQIDKDTSFKASLTDSLDFKAALTYKLSTSSIASIGLGYKNAAKDGDQYKFGMKLAFAG